MLLNSSVGTSDTYASLDAWGEVGGTERKRRSLNTPKEELQVEETFATFPTGGAFHSLTRLIRMKGETTTNRSTTEQVNDTLRVDPKGCFSSFNVIGGTLTLDMIPTH